MHRIIGIAVALYLLGDPELDFLSGLVADGQAAMAVIITLVMSPWLRAQFDH